MIRFLILFFLIFSFEIKANKSYYLYVAAESDDEVSLLKFDGKTIEELERIEVGVMPTEIEGPHGITVDPSGLPDTTQLYSVVSVPMFRTSALEMACISALSSGAWAITGRAPTIRTMFAQS